MNFLNSTVILSLVGMSFSAHGASFSDSELSASKKRHCANMVARFGPESGRMNGSVTPNSGAWQTHSIDEPGWFSSDLVIRKEQETSDGQYHLATCHWDKVGGFTLYLENFRYGEQVIVFYDF